MSTPLRLRTVVCVGGASVGCGALSGTLVFVQVSFGAHAVVVGEEESDRFLMLRPSCMQDRWALPGGHVDGGEDALTAVKRECREELGIHVVIGPLTGLYFQPEFDAQLAVFRATLPMDAQIVLSDEHVEFRWMTMDDLRAVMQSENGDAAVANALEWNGTVALGRY